MRINGFSIKALALALLALDIALFGNVLWPLLAHGLHVLVEIVELALEHVLEEAFDLTPRQAQSVLAYSALALAIYIAIKCLRRAYAAALQACQRARAAWQQCQQMLPPYYYPIATTLGALGVTLWLFS